MIQINNYELTSEEEQVLKSALEMYARVFQGQFGHLAEIFEINNTDKINPVILDVIKKTFTELQNKLHGDELQNWRITGNFVSRSALKAYRLELIVENDMQKADELLNHINIPK